MLLRVHGHPEEGTALKKRTIPVLLACALAVALALVAGCSSSSSTTGEHEPITIMDAQRDYGALIELVHEKYPEINIEVIPYRGRNMSAYTKQQLETGIMPDIYSSTQAWDGEYQEQNLVDLSRYDVANLYNDARISQYSVNDSLYLLPYDYQIQGITCNKTLLENNGIAIPTSFKQLREETIPALEAAGIEICDTLLDLPGTSFQYFFNISSSEFMNTSEGRDWRDSFTDTRSDTFATGNEGVQASVDYVQQWIDCGMLNADLLRSSSSELENHFHEGNTAFYIGSLVNFAQNKDGTGDQYQLLPYLSEDGTQNTYVVSTSRMYGLNKELENKGNEQKLEDALHVLEVMSTMEGYNAICGTTSTYMCSIKDFTVEEGTFYDEPLQAISKGHSMNMLYVGWENYLVPFGEAVYDWLKGESTGEQAIATLDDTKRSVQSQGVTYYATVTEELDTVQAAQLSGQMFMDATGADAALISYNEYDPNVKAIQENGYGANGHILPGNLTEETITIFLPTGWYDKISTVQVTGAEAKAMAAKGTDVRGTGHYYPYVFMTKDGNALDDNTTYTVVVCGYNKDDNDGKEATETSIVGLDAAKEYLLKVKEVSSKTLDDSLVQKIEQPAAE